mmetsp:Transcript_5903/g.13113  ORF Transcript_5903/g.13113 Transcript_5903/m.13113 type:complete len:217 (+) Transcript_5903:833-1483(+)
MIQHGQIWPQLKVSRRGWNRKQMRLLLKASHRMMDGRLPCLIPGAQALLVVRQKQRMLTRQKMMMRTKKHCLVIVQRMMTKDLTPLALRTLEILETWMERLLPSLLKYPSFSTTSMARPLLLVKLIEFLQSCVLTRVVRLFSLNSLRPRHSSKPMLIQAEMHRISPAVYETRRERMMHLRHLPQHDETTSHLKLPYQCYPIQPWRSHPRALNTQKL